MEIQHVITFNLALLAAILSPGPAFLYSLQTSLQGGRKAGVSAGLGLALMAATWTMLALLGVNGLFLLFPWAFLLFKAGGALYLIYIAWRTWSNASSAIEPCNLCWYQRIAMFPLALTLGLACLYNDFSIRRYALPLAIAGGAVALWHTLLYVGLISEAIVPCSVNGPSCTDANMTILGVIPLPMISLASFIVIALMLIRIPTMTKREYTQ